MERHSAAALSEELVGISQRTSKMADPMSIAPSEIIIDLKDERAVTKQCLQICENARSYIESLTDRESSLLQGLPQNATKDDAQNRFEAQLLTRQALNENRNSFVEIIGRLQERLESLVMNRDSRNDNERIQLQEDINSSKQCLEVCKVASEVSHQKIYRTGEVIVDSESDQVVATTLGDLLDVKKMVAKGNSVQLIGSMTKDALRHLAEKRYNGRFGALPRDSDSAEASSTSSHSVFGNR